MPSRHARDLPDPAGDRDAEFTLNGSVIGVHQYIGADRNARVERSARHAIYGWANSIEGSNMAGGWARDGAVQDQIDDTITDAVSSARARMPTGESETYCEECGEPIAQRRRIVLPGVRTCLLCQSARDARPAISGINRRGSKDSQLR